MSRVPRLEGKVTLITGAASGQGRAAAFLFASEGARVVAIDRDREGLAATVEEIRGAGGEALGQVMDVTDRAQVEAAADAAVERYGAIHVLYNNAAVYLRDRDAPVSRLDLDTWEETLAVNLGGVFLCCRAVIPALIAAGGGSIVNTASVSALIGTHIHAYAASKGGVLALSRSIATTYARQGIRCNVICPGLVNTPMVAEVMRSPELLSDFVADVPLRRAGEPVEIAQLALFLASDESSYVTGGVFVIDGGLTAA